MSRLRRAASSLGRFGWYPLLLATAWYLEVYAVGRVEPAAGARSFALVVVAAVAITVACIAVLGRDRGSMAAAIVLVGCIVVRQPILVVPFAAGFVLLLIERRWSDQGRMHLPWQRVHEGMTALVAVLLAIQIGQIVTFTEPAPMMARTAWAAQPVDAATTPNMYLILADAHGRADVLESLYHHDDQPFLDGLRDIGFDVASASHSNYALTRFALGSMLTSTYLDPLNSSRSTDWQDDFARRTIHENPAFPLLRRAGYQVTVISSGYEHLGLRSADRFIDTGQPNEFESALLSNIAVTDLWNLVSPGHAYDEIRARALAELAALEAVAAEPSASPKFVLAHLPVPHWPFIFDDQCLPSRPVNHAKEGLGLGSGEPALVAAVGAQTTCVDTLLSTTVGRIVESDPDAVVIVFSDHGPDEHLNWGSPDAIGIGERSANLFAARTPGHEALFPEDITLVNVLPTLFNAYLGTQLPTSPNQFWFGPRPADQTFVTEDPG